MAKSSSNWIRAFNQIKAKHFDFVVCAPETFTVVAVVELDDSSHRSKLAGKRDRVKDHACQSAGIPLLRFEVKSSYDVYHIGMQIQQVLAINGDNAPTG